MKYCEECKSLCENGECLICGSRKTRDVVDTDFCFVAECPRDFGEKLKSSLDQEKIVCALLPSGTGLNTRIGLPLENYKVFVPYANYYRVINVYNALISAKTLDDYKKQLLDNVDKWYILSKSTVKKIKKLYKLSNDEDVFDTIINVVENAREIISIGKTSFYNEAGFAVLVKYEKLSLFFNVETYEIII